MVERGPEWLSAIAEMNSGVAEDIAATEAKLRQLRGTVGTHGKLEHWIARTAEAASLPMQHFPYAEIHSPPSGNEADDTVRLQESFNESFVGGLPGAKIVSDQEMDKVVARREARSHEAPTDPAQDTVELNDLDEDDLVDWLMGTGPFDGNPRPPAALVLSAAEGDAPLAARLLKAEHRANPEGERGDLINALTEITKGKAGA